MKPEVMRVTRLSNVIDETDDTKTLYFNDRMCEKAIPGQYVMIWAPAVDEVPMSLSAIGPESSVTVRRVGPATEALHRLEVGDRIGIRGPHGNGFVVSGSSHLIVGGGVGVACLAPLAEHMNDRGLKPTFVMGARNAGLFLFRERIGSMLGRRLMLATDDGSMGFNGFASDLVERLLVRRRFEQVYTCGPELMMIKIFESAEERHIPVQASLERHFKCAVGLCGSCAIGPYRACADGPVFDSERLKTVRDEFGRRRMDPSGRKIAVDH